MYLLRNVIARHVHKVGRAASVAGITKMFMLAYFQTALADQLLQLRVVLSPASNAVFDADGLQTRWLRCGRLRLGVGYFCRGCRFGQLED
jgi:hypothetical protein